MRKADFSATLSTRALIMRVPIFGDSAQLGTRPQRSSSPRGLPSRSVVTVSTSSVGATLKRRRISIDSPTGKRARICEGSGAARL